jgi:hypothetical protein
MLSDVILQQLLLAPRNDTCGRTHPEGSQAISYLPIFRTLFLLLFALTQQELRNSPPHTCLMKTMNLVR